MRAALRDDLSREPVFWWALLLAGGAGLTLMPVAFVAVLLASLLVGVPLW